jgi:uncharacterized protein
MTDKNTAKTSLDFASLQAIIAAEGVNLHASEVHGVLTGLVCGGFSFEGNNYLEMITDLLNNGEALPNTVSDACKSLYSQLWQAILDDNFSFSPLIADDEDSLAERSTGLCAWVQGFTLGFGLQQKNSSDLSKDVQEVLTDFVEIANLSDEIDEDEASEQAFFEIAEYVRMSALLCFAELGVAPEQPSNDEAFH